MLKKRIQLDLLIGFSLIAFMVILTFIAVPMNYDYIFNFDESLELTRAQLLSRGYRFFIEVWNDHPLGLPFIFNSASKLFDLNLTTARYIVLAFSCLNLLTFYFLMRLDSNRFASATATILLIVSRAYIPLSGSVINEIPSLSLAILSLFLMTLYARHQSRLRYVYLLLSALIFVLSFEVKMSIITLLPTLLVMGLYSKQQLTLPEVLIKKSRDAAVWIITSTVVFSLLSFTILPFSYYHLLASHSNASEKMSLTDPDLTVNTLILSIFKNDTIYLLLVVLAILFISWSSKRFRYLPPCLWLGFNLLRFSLIVPVWGNYYIHLLIPGAWIICLFIDDLQLEKVIKMLLKGAGSLNESLTSLLFRSAIALLVLGQVVLNTAEIVTATHPRRYQNSTLVNMNRLHFEKSELMRFLERYQNSGKVILTDNPYYIHRYKLDTPPETAILSRKRVVTEELDGNFILEVIRRRNPDFVLLDRFADYFLESQSLSKYLEENYLEYELEDEDERLFILVNP
jgi:hypothetical protein